ncbi:MAG: nucleotidyltransferase domain-containing protein [Nanoarchaeota archaeon]|nr:nucleotidyltransferase domain-containing protein [Nanoarchaeota archaeon]
MISNKKIKLLETWKTNPFAGYWIAEIMKISKKRTKPWVFNALKQLTKNKLLLSKRKGNLDIYSLNLDNPFLMQTLQYLEAQNSLDFPHLDIIAEAIKKIPIKTYCLLIFGSYAGNKQTKESDLDICFLIESKQVEKKIKPYFNEVKLNHAINIDEHYIAFNDFVKMLLREEENLGKQIFRKQKLFYNVDIYYQLIKEAHKNGFRP